MKCANCGYNNPRGMKFCGECGAALPTVQPDVSCANCGYANRAVSRYCANCGRELVSSTTNQCAKCGQANRANSLFCANCGNRLRPYDERRIVTIIFGDIAGFTAMSEQLDPEEVKEISNACFKQLNEEVALYGGHVDKYLGDNIMVLFGAPVAHEDDAERAVRCALGMQLEVRKLSEQWERALANKHGLQFSLELHIGINTGEVMAGLMGGTRDQDYTVMGDAVNLASRLQHAADPGKILVGEQTYRATGDAVEYREMEPLKVRGKQMPVPVWEVVGVRAQRDRQRSSSTIEAPMVGRAALFSRLKSLYQAVVEQREATAALVSGEAGMGKSRFLLEFEKYVEGLPQSVTFRKGRCLRYGDSVSYTALGEVVRSECNILNDDASEVKYNKLNERVRELYANDSPRTAEERKQHEREVGEVILMLAVLLEVNNTAARLGEMNPQNRRDNTFLALRRFFEHIARQAPLVLAFEDTQWVSDEVLLQFIDYLTDTAKSAPILVIALARPELQEQYGDWVVRLPQSNIIELGRLSEAESSEVLDELLKSMSGQIPADLRETIISKVEGNPFFIEEMVRILRGGALSGSEAGAEAIRIPDTIQGLIGARIDSLAMKNGKEDAAGRDEKLVLQAAAVIGRRFWEGAVATLLNIPPPRVAAVLQALQGEGKEFIYENHSGSRFTEEREYSFRSNLIQEVAYNTLPKQQRSKWHADVADWIEQKAARAGRKGSDYVELLAYHYEEAARLELEVLSLSSKVAGSSRTITAKATQYLQEAGERERARQNIKAAANLYRRAIDRAEAGGRLGYNLQLLCSYAETLEVLGQYEEALRQIDTVNKLADEQGSDRYRACAMSQRANVYQVQGHLSEAEQLASAALQIYVSIGDQTGEADALHVLGKVTLNGDQMAKAQEYFQRLYFLCTERSDRNGQGLALSQLGEICFYRNEPKQSIWFVQEAQQIFNVLGDKRQVAVCMRQLAAIYRNLAEYHRAESYQKQALELMASLGDRSGVAKTVTGLAYIYLAQGKLDDALTTAHQAVTMNKEIGAASAIAWALQRLGIVYVALCEWDKAAQALDEALAYVEKYELLTVRAETYHGLAEVAIGRKDADTALLYVALGQAGLSEDDYFSQASLLRAQGQALALKGDGSAANCLLQSIKILEQHEYPAELAASYRVYADYLTTHGRDSEARWWQAKSDTVMLEANIRDTSESLTQMLPQVRGDERLAGGAVVLAKRNP